jgi:hypothetical protein
LEGSVVDLDRPSVVGRRYDPVAADPFLDDDGGTKPPAEAMREYAGLKLRKAARRSRSSGSAPTTIATAACGRRRTPGTG